MTDPQALREFLAPIPKDARVVVLHDWDADGISAGVVLELALAKLGYVDVVRMAPDRERNAETVANRARLGALEPDALFVLDLGIPADPVLSGVPTCYIDHHRPEGNPADSLVLSAYDENPIRNTSLLVWDLLGALLPNGEMAAYDWIAALGTISDLGEKAPFEFLASTRKKYTAKYLKEVVALINALRRAPDVDPEIAARPLHRFPGPRELFDSTFDADVAAMRAARERLKREMDEAKKVGPRFAGPAALIEIHSPFQIHPLLAHIWRSRLPKHYVIVANHGYLPGRVNFSARSQGDLKVLEFLRSVKLDVTEGAYGRGHDHASGGSLTPADWSRYLEKLGFAPKAPPAPIVAQPPGDAAAAATAASGTTTPRSTRKAPKSSASRRRRAA